MNSKRMENLTKRQFDHVMNREGEDVRDYFDRTKTYRVFYRRTARSNSPMSSIRIYYSQDAGIHLGTIIEVHGVYYIVYSQDALESEVYYTSVANRCNTTLTIRGVTLPTVVQQDNFSIERGSLGTYVAGTVILYTQQNQYADQIEVNYRCRKFGNVYSVGNKFSNDGIQYYYLDQILNPTGDYTMEYYGETTFFMDETSTYRVPFVVLESEIAMDPQPPLTYTTSDASIATIDSTGLMTFHNPGDVTVTCTCDDPSLVKSVRMTIGAVRVRTYSITASNNIWKMDGGYKVFTLHSFDPHGNEDTDTYLDNTHTYTWTVDRSEVDAVLTWANGDKPYKKKGKLELDMALLNTTVNVICTLDGTVVASKEMEISRL